MIVVPIDRLKTAQGRNAMARPLRLEFAGALSHIRPEVIAGKPFTKPTLTDRFSWRC
jgi:hypothetical protein